MNKAILQRIWNDKVTFWNLNLWFDHPKIYFIAPSWQNNKENISHIPAGLYNIKSYRSTLHPDAFEILNVPNRTNILIHSGNYACDVFIGKVLHKTETKGCFMPGLGYDIQTPMVKSSVIAMQYLIDNLPETWSLEIKIN